jgi:D-3-phosphoglycerate dehydrogenase
MSGHHLVRVTSRSFGRQSPAGVELLQAAGCAVAFAGPDGPWPEERMRQWAFDADALIVGADPVTRAVLQGARRLRVVAKHGAGVDNIDLAAAAQSGVTVTYAPGGNARSVAEMTIALLLAVWRCIPRADARMRARIWESAPGREAAGRTLGIIGLGHIGRETARLARALGMGVLGHDIAEDPAFAAAHAVRYDSLRGVLEAADAVVVHVPLTSRTRGMLGAQELAWMRPDGWLARRSMSTSGNLHGTLPCCAWTTWCSRRTSPTTP